jgi:hypothetical protein
MVRHQAALVSGKLTRVMSGVNLPSSEVIMSMLLSMITLIRKLTQWLDEIYQTTDK